MVSYQPTCQVRSADLARAYTHQMFDLSYRVPDGSAVHQNFPNPFNPETWIPYELATGSKVVVRIYDLSGNPVRTLSPGYRSPGFYLDRQRAIYWDGRDDSGQSVASGTYFYQLMADGFSATRKMVILR